MLIDWNNKDPAGTVGPGLLNRRERSTAWWELFGDFV